MKQPHIAIADDHDLLRNGLAELLRSSGYGITTLARNGQELIDALQAATALPKVCIVDMKMPRLNGFETARTIKARWPEVKVLLFSLEAEEEMTIRAAQCGADGYYSKDGDFNEMERELKLLCGQD